MVTGVQTCALPISNLLQLNEIRLKYEQTISDLKIENSHLNHQLSNSKLPVIGKESKLLLKVKLDKDSILNQIETSDVNDSKENFKLINKTNLSPCKEYKGKSDRGKGTRRKSKCHA